MIWIYIEVADSSGKTMLNLDTEDWNEIFIGCAGGGDSLLNLQVQTEKAPADSQLATLTVKGEKACPLHLPGPKSYLAKEGFGLYF